MSKRNRKGNAVSSRKKSAVYGMKKSRRRSGMTMGRDAERRAAGLHPHGKRAIEEIEGILALLESGDLGSDDEMRSLANSELADAKDRLAALEKELMIYLTPGDPRDSRSVILEIRAGAGGEESALFASDLFKMYKGYAALKGFDVSVVDMSPTELGGYKEIIAEIDGSRAYSRMKFESGVHRVQRVPVTESGGRVHTSTATVAVLPKAEPTDFEINPNGVLNIGFGPEKTDRIEIARTDSKEYFDIRADRTEDGWEVYYRVPLKFIRLFYPEYRFEGKLAADMFKCGNKTVNRHYISWTDIDLETPNFHCPQYFGEWVFK